MAREKTRIPLGNREKNSTYLIITWTQQHYLSDLVEINQAAWREDTPQGSVTH